MVSEALATGWLGPLLSAALKPKVAEVEGTMRCFLKIALRNTEDCVQTDQVQVARTVQKVINKTQGWVRGGITQTDHVLTIHSVDGPCIHLASMLGKPRSDSRLISDSSHHWH